MARLLTGQPSQAAMDLVNLGTRRTRQGVAGLLGRDPNQFLTNQERAQDQLQGLMNRPADLSSVEGYTNFLKLQLQANPQNQTAILQAGLPSLQALQEQDRARQARSTAANVIRESGDNENEVSIQDQRAALFEAGVSAADIKSLLGGGGGNLSQQIVNPQTFQTGDGNNKYLITATFDRDNGAIVEKRVPLAGSVPFEELSEEDRQSLRRVAQSPDLNAYAEKQDITQLTDIREKYLEQQVQVNENIILARQMLAALNKINTGGFTEEIANSFTDIFGKTASDATMFKTLAGELMISKLRAFGANPTEGERASAQKLIPEINKTKEANERLINNFLELNQRKRNIINFSLTNANAVSDITSYSKALYEDLFAKENKPTMVFDKTTGKITEE